MGRERYRIHLSYVALDEITVFELRATSSWSIINFCSKLPRGNILNSHGGKNAGDCITGVSIIKLINVKLRKAT